MTPPCILTIEDDSAIRRGIADALCFAGYDVIEAGDGTLGSEMALKFLAAGHDLTVYDINPERLAPSISAGAKIADSSAELTQKVGLVMTSLRSSDIWVSVAESELLPHAEPGQVFIDLGTTIAHQIRRLAEAFSEKSATLLDVPVSGGPNGIRNGNR